MERVTAVSVPQDVPGLFKTPAKPNAPTSGAVKATPDSGKKSQPSTKQVALLFWKDLERGKEDAEARKQEKRWKKFTGPVLSLDDHEDLVTTLMNRAAPSQVLQPPSKAPSTSSKDRGKTWRKHPPVADLLDDKPLSDKADEPKPKSRKRDPTPELVVLDDDDSTPLPGKIKAMGKKSRSYNPQEEEALEALSQRLKGEAQAIQYNLELAILTDYRNLHIPNLKGPPNTDDHLAYLSKVKDVSWSYPVKGNIITTHQFFKELKASNDREVIEQGDNVLKKRVCLGSHMRASKLGQSRPSTLFMSSIALRAKSSMPATRTMEGIGILGCMISSARPQQRRWRGVGS